MAEEYVYNENNYTATQSVFGLVVHCSYKISKKRYFQRLKIFLGIKKHSLQECLP